MKVAVISQPLPPMAFGQSVILYRLFKAFRADDYCLISTLNFDSEHSSRRLPCKYFQISNRGELTRGYRFGLSIIRESYNITVAAYLRARQIARIVRQEKCEAIMSCSGGFDLLDVPAGFIASRLARVPFYVYLFDTYSHMWLELNTQVIGSGTESLILKRAAGVIATNEAAAEFLRSRYGVASRVIHNPCDLSEYESGPRLEVNAGREKRIVYTGSVYAAHYDVLRNLVMAVEQIARPEVKVHLYTSTSNSQLQLNGIRGPVVYHGHQPSEAMARIQQSADVLFLGLAFEAPYPDLIKMSSPGKLGELLASRRPILLHAPPESFLSTYFRRYECGVVVDENDPGKLSAALARLIDDTYLQHRLSENAWARALADFDLVKAQNELAKLLNLKGA